MSEPAAPESRIRPTIRIAIIVVLIAILVVLLVIALTPINNGVFSNIIPNL